MIRLYPILLLFLLLGANAFSQDSSVEIQEKASVSKKVSIGDDVSSKPNVKKKKEISSVQSSTVVAETTWSNEEEITPFLTGYYFASEDKNDISFGYTVKNLSRKLRNTHMAEEGSKPKGFYFPTFPANVKLALFFRNWPTDISDSSLEYRFIKINGNVGDTSIPWKKTGSYLIIPKLNSGDSYLLMVRYQNDGNNISTYFINTHSSFYPVWVAIRNSFPFLLLISIPFCIFLLWKFIATRRRSRQYQLELKALFSQLNPHFLFNSLSSIQGLMNNNEIEKANQYLSGFSGLLRTTLDKGGKETIPLSEELDNLENYIRFERLRFNFRYEKDIEPQLPLGDILIPPLIAQPIIENSVKHGLAGMDEKGVLILRIYSVNRDLFLSIKDNGKGFDIKSYQPGYGIDLVQKRIELYNKWHRKSKIYLTMKSEPGNTMMILQFQKWLPK